MFFKSVEKLAVVTAGANGVMGTITPDTHDIYANYLVSQSFNVNMPKGTVIREWRDGADAPSIAIPGRSEGATITFRLERLTNALLDLFIGGTIAGSAPAKFSKSSARSTSYNSIAMTAHAANSQQFYWEIPYGLLNTGLIGSPSLDAEGKVELDCSFEALVPVDAAGEILDIWDTWDLLDT